MKAAAKQILHTAMAELGYRESPAGSNRTKYGAWYGMDGQPWCVMFVQWVFHHAGAAELLPLRTASCGALMRSAKTAGLWVTADYRPGDLAVFDFSGRGTRTDHIGIVIEAGNGALHTIEGNTGDGNDSSGGQVLTRLRPLNVVRGAVRPAYGEEETDMDNSPSSYAEEAVQWARDKGILYGNTAGDLKLHDTVTREQALTFLYRFAKCLGNV